MRPKIAARVVRSGEKAKVTLNGTVPEIVALLCCIVDNLAEMIGTPNSEIIQNMADVIRECEEDPDDE